MITYYKTRVHVYYYAELKGPKLISFESIEIVETTPLPRLDGPSLLHEPRGLPLGRGADGGRGAAEGARRAGGGAGALLGNRERREALSAR